MCVHVCDREEGIGKMDHGSRETERDGGKEGWRERGESRTGQREE